MSPTNPIGEFLNVLREFNESKIAFMNQYSDLYVRVDSKKACVDESEFVNHYGAYIAPIRQVSFGLC